MDRDNMNDRMHDNSDESGSLEGEPGGAAVENTGQALDIRVMKLNKWYVPKSYTLEQAPADTIVLGYFDALEVREVKDEKKRHPFTAGYERLAVWKREQRKQENGQAVLENGKSAPKEEGGASENGQKAQEEEENLVDFSSQEQLLFLNLWGQEGTDGVHFSKEAVDDFWAETERACPYLFLSMIHITPGGTLEKALKKIHSVFQEDYLSYISYDYCDIVLFARDMQIPQFMGKIRGLFRPDAQGKDGKSATIFDTFSMVSFYSPKAKTDTSKKDASQAASSAQPEPEGAQKKFAWAGRTDWETWVEGAEEPFQATVNLSIRNYEKFEGWYKAGKMPAEMYHMFGRHDISITQNKADTNWLMEVMHELHEKQHQKMFWTFETFIKVKEPDSKNTLPSAKGEAPEAERQKTGDVTDQKTMRSADSEHLKETYQKVAKELRGKIQDLEKCVAKAGFSPSEEDRYMQPVYEVLHCICSIVKNGFAEEFVCCVYESFLHFLSYMTKQIGSLVEGEEADARQKPEQKERC